MKRYYIKTFGCQQNSSDSERIVGFLEKKGYKKAKNLGQADLVVVNACSVRQSAIDRVLGLKQKFGKLKTQNSPASPSEAGRAKLKTILTGCVLKSDKKKFREYFDKILSIDEFLGKDYLCLKPSYTFKNSAFVPIMTGCNNFCSYCVVPYTRGREISMSMNEIIEEVKKLVENGYKEITLLGQNVNSFKPSFVNLLKTLNNIYGNFEIKFLTNHPRDFSDELIGAVAKYKKIAKEIHLPIQSGDDEILRKMNRGYTVKQYKNLIKKIRQKIPNVRLSTDVIVGFPGETRKQFKNTVKLFKEIQFDKAFINKYSPRFGTAAYKLKDDVSWDEKKRRWRILNKIVNPDVTSGK